MKTAMNTTRIAICLAAVLAASLVPTAAKPLKVYIMAGQSNMQGRARDHTLPHMESHPDTAPMAKKMVDEKGEFLPIDEVWIAALGVRKNQEEKTGPLSIGFGYDGGSGIKIGPEMGFGITMQEHLKEPVLIIKTTWGGKSLFCDFRPPSAGPWDFGPGAAATDKDPDATRKARREISGVYYRKMVDYVGKVLADIKRVYPDHDPDQGYEIAGFMWFQGVHDYGDAATYPNQGEPGSYDEYSRLLACFIRDLRKDFKTPGMPFVIGVLGIGGDMRHMDNKLVPWTREFRKAMAAPAKLSEFKGNVAAVHTEKFWDHQLEELHLRFDQYRNLIDELKREQIADLEEKPSLRRVRLNDEYQSKLETRRKTIYTDEEWKLMETGVSNAAYHYLGSYKIYSRIGKAFAETLIGMSEDLLARPLESVWKAFSEEPGTGLADVWHVKDGVLVSKGSPKGGIYLDREVADFTLRFEWRWPAKGREGKGGVLIRTVGPWKLWPRSLEAQINAGGVGDFWGLDGFLFEGPAERLEKIEHPQFGKLTHLPRTAAVEKPAGEWNQYEIVAKGPVVTLTLNGQVVNQATGCDPRPGRICLTAEGSEIRFRNIRLIPALPNK